MIIFFPNACGIISFFPRLLFIQRRGTAESEGNERLLEKKRKTVHSG
jgi:hypothetical protein